MSGGRSQESSLHPELLVMSHCGCILESVKCAYYAQHGVQCQWFLGAIDLILLASHSTCANAVLSIVGFYQSFSLVNQAYDSGAKPMLTSSAQAHLDCS